MTIDSDPTKRGRVCIVFTPYGILFLSVVPQAQNRTAGPTLLTNGECDLVIRYGGLGNPNPYISFPRSLSLARVHEA